MSSIIVLALLITAGLLGLVGGLGLMGTMGLNVLERTREIGVLRAIGARAGTVMRVVVTESVVIGGLSWLLGALLALPLSQLLCAAVGRAFTGSALRATPSLGGMALVLLAAVGLASLASWLPARSAARVTVRTALAYE